MFTTSTNEASGNLWKHSLKQNKKTILFALLNNIENSFKMPQVILLMHCMLKGISFSDVLEFR